MFRNNSHFGPRAQEAIYACRVVWQADVCLRLHRTSRFSSDDLGLGEVVGQATGPVGASVVGSAAVGVAEAATGAAGSAMAPMSLATTHNPADSASRETNP